MAAGWRVTLAGLPAGTGIAGTLADAWADAVNWMCQHRLIRYEHLTGDEVAAINGVYVNPANVEIGGFLVETFEHRTAPHIHLVRRGA